MLTSEPCPFCRMASCTDVSEKEHKYTYGIGEDAVELSVLVNVHSCTHCGEFWLGEDSEETMMRAINYYLFEQSKRAKQFEKDLRFIAEYDGPFEEDTAQYLIDMARRSLPPKPLKITEKEE